VLVLNVSGSPVAEVSLEWWCCDSPIDGVFARGRTDASGRATLTATRTSSNVRVTKEGYQRVDAPVR
jgi:hypothetical protein